MNYNNTHLNEWQCAHSKLQSSTLSLCPISASLYSTSVTNRVPKMNGKLQKRFVKLCQTCEAIESQGDDTAVQTVMVQAQLWRSKRWETILVYVQYERQDSSASLSSSAANNHTQEDFPITINPSYWQSVGRDEHLEKRLLQFLDSISADMLSCEEAWI